MIPSFILTYPCQGPRRVLVDFPPVKMENLVGEKIVHISKGNSSLSFVAFDSDVIRHSEIPKT